MIAVSRFGGGMLVELPRRDMVASIVATYSFAVALPLIDLLRQDVAFFIVRGSPPLDYLLFVALVAFAGPAILVASVLLLPGRWRRWAHTIVLGLVSSVFALQLAKRALGLPVLLQVAVALLLGGVFVFAVLRFPGIRQFCRYCLALPLVAIMLFLMTSDVRAVMAATNSSSATITGPGDRNVVMVVFDELPVISLMDGAGQINRSRFPNFARLAEITTWFADTSTAVPSTIEAIPSLLTGNYPDGSHSALPIFNTHPNSLFTTGAFDRIVANEPATRLCPPTLCRSEAEPASDRLLAMGSDVGVVALHMILPENLAAGLPPVDENWGYFGDQPENREAVQEAIRSHLLADRGVAFEQFVEGMDSASDSSTLFFIHTMIPHRPWVYLPDGSRYLQIARIPGIDRGTWLEHDWLVDQGLQRHLLQAGFADLLLGELLDKLEEMDMFEDTILVVTSDHGVSFEPGMSARQPDSRARAMVATVPLFISLPGREGSFVDTPVELIDVLPTIADLIGTDLSAWELDGHTLTGGGDSQPRLLQMRDDRQSIGSLAADRDQMWHAVNERVPLKGGWDAIFNSGVRRHLVGAEVSSQTLGTPTDWVAVVDDLSAHQSADFESRPWPLMVTGFLDGIGDQASVDLAIVINGRISTVTRTFDQRRASMFSALTRIQDMSESQRDLAIYAVDGVEGAEILRQVEITGAKD